MADNEESIGGSIFWIVLWLATFSGIVWLGIWSRFEQSIEALVVAIVFGLMLISAPVFVGAKRFFSQGTWSQNSLSFTIGFWLYIILGTIFGSGAKSVFAVTKPQILGTTLAELPRFMRFVIEKFVIPASEESFFLITIPFGLYAILRLMAKNDKLGFLDNPFIQTFLVLLLGGSAFALFHVGKLFTAFVVSAILFRSISIIFSQEDDFGDLIPFATLVTALGVGMHVGNNWISDTGLVEGFQILASHPIGWFILVFLGIIFLSAGNQVGMGVKKLVT